MNKMMCVPVDTITGKDLDYLSDMFQWNFIAFKKGCNDVEYVSTPEIVDFFGKATDFFEQNLNTILDILNNPGGEVDE